MDVYFGLISIVIVTLLGMTAAKISTNHEIEMAKIGMEQVVDGNPINRIIIWKKSH
jgi:hypothetical protein